MFGKKRKKGRHAEIQAITTSITFFSTENSYIVNYDRYCIIIIIILRVRCVSLC